MEVRIVIPKSDDSPLCDMLEEITKAIHERDPDLVAHGLLGGEFGYGGHWNSEVFQMHPFCWCEEDTCPWCFYNVNLGEPPLECAAEKGADNQHGDGIAPHFWHKPSGLKVWWYKYFGRDAEVVNAPADLSPILAECLADIRNSECGEGDSDERR